jgi:hypothetical protein
MNTLRGIILHPLDFKKIDYRIQTFLSKAPLFFSEESPKENPARVYHSLTSLHRLGVVAITSSEELIDVAGKTPQNQYNRIDFTNPKC